MQRYGGTVLYERSDEMGPLEIIADGFTRSLHFGSEPKQSSMDLNDPYRLTLLYSRAMVTSLLFHATPRRALLIGLGGGSLAKFLLHHFPACHIDVVEYRESVHRLARNYFCLPDDPRLRVHIADAGEFVRRVDTDCHDYDLIMVDAFTGGGIAHSTVGLSFFDHCRRQLCADGVLTTNLWSSDTVRLEEILQDIGNTFDGRMLRLPVAGKANMIALATQHGTPHRQLRRLTERARELQEHTSVEFTVLLNQLRKHNRRWF